MENVQILVVEDESIVAIDIQNRLKGLGYSVAAIASSGEEAIKKAEETHPDLVLMDIRLRGDMDGIEAAKQIHAHLNIPVVYLTAYADDKTLERAKVTEPFGYILKPLEERELHSTIHMALYKHRIERRLAEEKIKLETALESMTDGIVMLDDKGKLAMTNSTAKRIFYLVDRPNKITIPTLEELLGFNPVSLLKEKKKRSLRRDVNISGTPYQIELSSIVSDEGKFLGTVMVSREISREKEIDQMKSEFISVTSHELRTPLTSIRNAVDIILGEKAGKLNKDQKKFLSLAGRNIDRLSGLVNALLDISRIESGKMRIKFDCFELNAPVEAAIASLRAMAKAKSIPIHKEIPSDLPAVYGDSDRVEQVFINLLHNAIKFTPEGGHVYVSARLVPSSEFVVGSEEKAKEVRSEEFVVGSKEQTEKVYESRTKDYGLDKDFIEASVQDTGVGIPPEYLHRIFDKFYRAEESSTKGTGLGLAIVKGLIEAHQGRIWVESEVGKGSKFTFILPQYSPEKALKDYFSRELERARETDTVLSVVILKVVESENLTKIYGEAEILKLLDQIKQVVQNTARRATDRVEIQRVGQVIVILADTPRDGASALIKRLGEMFSRQKFKMGGEPVRVTLMLDVATYPEDGDDPDELIEKAEKRLGVGGSVFTVRSG